jgi:signal transduction histidine kinase
MMHRPTILYIEDNPDNQRLVRRVLESRGYQVLLADDGPSGLALARAGRPDLVLIDINIPTLDGYETTTRLRDLEHLRATPIVALTADTRAAARERSLAAGCDGFIAKPVDVRRLPEQLQEFMQGKREELPSSVEAAALRDYTRKLVARLEQQVREVQAANAELQTLDRLKSQFLAMLSHELRTPLTSILGYVELFERGMLGPLQPAQAEAISVMARNAQTLSRHLNSLLYLQEVRSSHLRRTPVLAHELLRRIMLEYQARAAAAGLEVQASIPEVGPLHGDALAIDQAFRHLIDNAVNFTPAGGRVRVMLADEPGRLVLKVQDTGIGIPIALQSRIFEPFYRVNASLTGPDAGVGIGLAIVQHVAAAHGGQVTVRSQPGAGSEFTLWLPRG